jgi:transcriptional regulator with GAF, ATPase, and Fis domain
MGRQDAARDLLTEAIRRYGERSPFDVKLRARLVMLQVGGVLDAPYKEFDAQLQPILSTARKKKMRWHLATALMLQGEALLRASRAEEALASFAEAATIARRSADRPSFWQATYSKGLALEQMLRYEQALACYRVAALTIQEIAMELEEERYRESFMSQPMVHQVMERYSNLRTQVGKQVRRDIATMNRSERISRRMLGALNTIGQTLSSTLDLGELLSLILDLAIENVRAERGIVFLLDEQSGEMRPECARGMDRSDLEEISSFSRSVVGRAAAGQSLLTVDVNKDSSLSAYESLVLHEIKSILCVPMRARGKVTGVIYLDTRRATQLFSDRERAFVESFSGQAAIAVENAKLFGTMDLENARLRREIEGRSRFGSLIGTSRALGRLTHVMGSVLESDCNVLIVGESGTGKELVARALHYHGPRHKKKFVAIDCGALPENLLEAELFGYARGAFTGAERDRVGLIEAASGGTLFLDEITNTTTALQARLLRVLQERVVRRLGENAHRPVDVRFIAATNADIRSLMAKGHFRQDLYYRLNVVTLEAPPLRDRREDIPLLVSHFLSKGGPDDRAIKNIAPGVMRALQGYDWPGNVRELQNAIERAVVLSTGRTIGVGDFSDIIPAHQSGVGHGTSASALPGKPGEHLMIEEALRRCLGDKAKAARYIGWNRQKLYRRMRSFKIPTDYGKAA